MEKFEGFELVGESREVVVSTVDGWHVFEGRVESQAARLALFSAVTSMGGATRIVDRLMVGVPASSWERA